MKKLQRINWKQGMEITPEIFIESDDYHIAERQLLGMLLSARCYGLFPNSKFTMDYELHNNQIAVSISDCIALVSSGYVVNIQNKTSFNKELPTDETVECYVVLSVVLNADKLTDESELHIVPQYDISFKKINEPIENGIPVLKICRKNASWEVAHGYIPPSIAINSIDSLANKYVEIKNIIHKILAHYAENDSNHLLLMLLQLDLNNFSSKESPEALTLMMKKFASIFQSCLKTGKAIEPLPEVRKFVESAYNHNEIGKILDTGYASLMEILKILETKPMPEIEEIKV